MKRKLIAGVLAVVAAGTVLALPAGSAVAAPSKAPVVAVQGDQVGTLLLPVDQQAVTVTVGQRIAWSNISNTPKQSYTVYSTRPNIVHDVVNSTDPAAIALKPGRAVVIVHKTNGPSVLRVVITVKK